MLNVDIDGPVDVVFNQFCSASVRLAITPELCAVSHAVYFTLHTNHERYHNNCYDVRYIGTSSPSLAYASDAPPATAAATTGSIHLGVLRTRNYPLP